MDPKQITEKLRLYISEESWIDGNAITQAKGVSEMEGVEQVVGFPDLHPGKGGPVDIAVKTKEVIYPSLIGNDAGCGIGLWMIDAKRRKLKLDKWADKLTDLDQPWKGEAKDLLDENGGNPDLLTDALGTIGGGNHFGELQAVERVEDAERFKALKMEEDFLFVCVHSGSRGLGQMLLNEHVAKHGYGPLRLDEAGEYLKKQDDLVLWAKVSRLLIAHRFAEAIRSEVVYVLSNSCHNSIERDTMVHRKGAAPSGYEADPLRTAVMIPGSRGSFSYLVQPVGGHWGNLNSIAHGAGRKWARSDCKDRLSDKYSVESLEQTALGSRVICEDKDLIYEEAPQAYKNIEIVIKDLVELGLVKVIAVFKPLITYKVRRDGR